MRRFVLLIGVMALIGIVRKELPRESHLPGGIIGFNDANLGSKGIISGDKPSYGEEPTSVVPNVVSDDLVRSSDDQHEICGRDFRRLCLKPLGRCKLNLAQIISRNYYLLCMFDPIAHKNEVIEPNPAILTCLYKELLFISIGVSMFDQGENVDVECGRLPISGCINGNFELKAVGVPRQGRRKLIRLDIHPSAIVGPYSGVRSVGASISGNQGFSTKARLLGSSVSGSLRLAQGSISGHLSDAQRLLKMGGISFPSRSVSDLLRIGASSEPQSFDPQQRRRDGQYQGEQRHPYVWLKPQYASLGGLFLCSLFNLFGGWLYLHDDRRPTQGWIWRGSGKGTWSKRRLSGAALVLCGVCVGLGGFVLSALLGGGY